MTTRDEATVNYVNILKAALRNGVLTNSQGAAAAGVQQGYHRLRRLELWGLLKHENYNRWVPTAELKAKVPTRFWKPAAANKKCPACGITPRNWSDCDCLMSDFNE